MARRVPGIAREDTFPKHNGDSYPQHRNPTLKDLGTSDSVGRTEMAGCGTWHNSSAR